MTYPGGLRLGSESGTVPFSDAKEEAGDVDGGVVASHRWLRENKGTPADVGCSNLGLADGCVVEVNILSVA